MVIPSPGNLLSKVEDALLAMRLLTKLLHTSTALLILFTYVTLTFDLKDSKYHLCSGVVLKIYFDSQVPVTERMF